MSLTNLTTGAAVLGSSPTHLFARGGGNFFRSDDQGDSWTMATNPEFLNPSNCGFYFADRYFAGLNSAQACILYTENDGDTWTAATGAPTATAENVINGAVTHTNTAYFVYVALDENGRPIPVPPLILESDEEKARFERAAQRQARRLQQRH